MEGVSDDDIRKSFGKNPDDRTSEACFVAIMVLGGDGLGDQNAIRQSLMAL